MQQSANPTNIRGGERTGRTEGRDLEVNLAALVEGNGNRAVYMGAISTCILE
jgi:hypothetical protein